MGKEEFVLAGSGRSSGSATSSTQTPSSPSLGKTSTDKTRGLEGSVGVLGALEVVVGVERAGGFGGVFAFAGGVVLVGVDAGDSEAANMSLPSLVGLVCILEGRGGCMVAI